MYNTTDNHAKIIFTKFKISTLKTMQNMVLENATIQINLM